jgi:hypothetical protein
VSAILDTALRALHPHRAAQCDAIDAAQRLSLDVHQAGVGQRRVFLSRRDMHHYEGGYRGHDLGEPIPDVGTPRYWGWRDRQAELIGATLGAVA